MNRPEPMTITAGWYDPPQVGWTVNRYCFTGDFGGHIRKAWARIGIQYASKPVPGDSIGSRCVEPMYATEAEAWAELAFQFEEWVQAKRDELARMGTTIERPKKLRKIRKDAQ